MKRTRTSFLQAARLRLKSITPKRHQVSFICSKFAHNFPAKITQHLENTSKYYDLLAPLKNHQPFDSSTNEPTRTGQLESACNRICAIRLNVICNRNCANCRSTTRGIFVKETPRQRTVPKGTLFVQFENGSFVLYSLANFIQISSRINLVTQMIFSR